MNETSNMSADTQRGERECGARSPQGWWCTRIAGHEGEHTAETNRRTLGSWPNVPDEARA